MLILSERGRRKWFKGSNIIPEKVIWPLETLSENSIAAGLLKSPNLREAIGEVDTDLWINHESSPEFVIHEESIKIDTQLVLTMLWWKDETQIVRLV